jgi:hypothetical protein
MSGGGRGASGRTGGTGASATSGAVAGPAPPEVSSRGNDDVLSRTATNLSCVP